MSDNSIKFVSDKNFRFMSNFHGAPVTYQGVLYKTSEHAYQAAKTNDVEWKKKITEAATPSEARKLGNQCPMRDSFEQKKVSIMHKIVEAKFRQNPELARRLIHTGTRPIIEDAVWDSFWGTGRHGNGHNMLGRILHRVRKTLQGEDNAS